jgi:hypothetical protein
MEPLINIVIPTYNRPTCVSLFLERIKSADPEDLSIFRIDFFDSSDNEKTSSLFSDLPAKLQNSIFYHRLPSETDPDDKLIVMLKSVNSPFCYLLGDGYLLNFHELKRLFVSRKDAGDNVILIAPETNTNYSRYIRLKTNRDEAPLVYDDPMSFFQDFFWLATLYGATIISKNILDFLFLHKLPERYGHCNFAYPGFLFDYASQNHLQASVQLTSALSYNPNKTSGGWEKKEYALKIWSHNMCKTIDTLSAFYNPVKGKTLLQIGQLTGFFTKKGLLLMRERGLVSFRLLKQYKPDIKRTVLPYPFFKIVCLIPRWALFLPYKGVVLLRKLKKPFFKKAK